MQICKELEKLFQILNENIFDNMLSMPIITVAFVPRAQLTSGWYLRVGKNSEYEIYLWIWELEKPIEIIVQNILHCMIHEYCHLQNISESSRNGRYHNKLFAEYAEKYGLLTEFKKDKGYLSVGIDENIKCLIREKLNGWDDGIKKEVLLKKEKKDYKMISTGCAHSSAWISWKCPICNRKARASANSGLYCGNCMTPMVRDEIVECYL